MLESQRLSLRNLIAQFIKESKTITQLKQLNTQILLSPVLTQSDHRFLISRLLFTAALSDFASLHYASTIFQTIKHPDLPLYNIMIRAYASNLDKDHAYASNSLILFKKMLSNGISPDCLTIPFLVKVCTNCRFFRLGRSVHGLGVLLGYHGDLFVGNSLIKFYTDCGFASDARNLFDEMPNRDVISWNSIISGCLRRGNLDEALGLFREMKDRSIITWNSIITGLVQGGRPKEALELFHEMQSQRNVNRIRADKITIASVLTACSSLGAIDQGKMVHDYLKSSGLECDMVMGTALVDMYGKCGNLETAYKIFREMPEKDTLAWTAMISVLALHGYGKEAFDLFKEMQSERVKPNHVTFVALLSACCHSGFVELGRWCFSLMKDVYFIEPEVHHYACMVDILARAGFFEEAEGVIREMPMEPDVFVWGALLAGCQMHGNVELGEKAAKCLIDLEPENHAFYVKLCDLYGKAGRDGDAERVRRLMKELGIKKEVPGCSVIEVN